MPFRPLFFLAALLFFVSARGDTVPDRKGAVLGDRAAMEKDVRWIYNDIQKGFAKAKLEGKPVLVVLRCVPCLACAGIDASVLQEASLAPMLDRFVCVRVINANAIDLSLFQFDYDLSFSTIFFNGDGTIYGRYGSWTHQKDSKDRTTAGFRKALEGALALHKHYPGNKTELVGKQGGPMPFKDPLEIPGLAGKYNRELDWNGKVVQSCVHCHMVGDAVRSHYRKETKTIPAEWIYPWPAPEAIGLSLATEDGTRVQSVAANSAAAKAGLKAGDEIISINGQPLISMTDIGWILHRSPDAAELHFNLGGGRETKLKLENGWRLQSDISRRVGTWPMRAMALGGLFMEDLSDDERAKRGLDKNSMALFVKHAAEYGIHGAAKKAGFQKEDVVISIDGNSSRVTESALIGALIRNHPPGDQVKATVLRGDKRLDLTLPLQ